ncbi:MAG: glycosyltransferase family 4 protein [Desulfoprunum sp.]|uniref:glycosyltransferase family 4 protein n=1 Tax=Desulfoprunum sp. TaxID=2020866 RepID=UPI000A79C820
MKILLIAPQPFYQDRGTPIAVRLLARTLGEQGHAVHLLVFHEGEDIAIPNVTIHRSAAVFGIKDIKSGLTLKKLVCDVFVAVKAIRLARAHRFDCLHAVEEGVFIAMMVNKLFAIPYVYDMDSLMSLQIIEKFPSLRPLRCSMEWVEKKAVLSSNGVVAVCRALEDTARRYAPDKLIVRLEDISLVEGEAGEAEDLRQRLGIAGLMLMYVGNLEKYQGIDLLLEGFRQASGQQDNLNLVIIGGSQGDIEAYRQQAQRAGIADRVFFCGPRPVEMLGSYLRQADILVSPRTQGNNTPMKIYSYLDSGRPVLATKLATHTQVLDDTISYLVEPVTGAMAQGILTLAGNAELRSRLGARARDRVRDEYSLPVFKKKVADFYRRLSIS